MALKILITGASGLLGKYLLETQPLDDSPEGTISPKYRIYPCYRNNRIKNGIHLDVSNAETTLVTLFDLNPDVIIHCAANGDVDSVEKNPSLAVKADLLGTIHLKDYAEKMACKLIIISTNAVYDGKNPPYLGVSPHNPINFYGKIKSLADQIVMQSSCDWLIIRPIFLFGWNYSWGRHNWAIRIIKTLKSGQPLKLVTDSFTQPTYAGDLAKFIWHCIENNLCGAQFNFSSLERSSLYQFGLKVKNIFNLPGSIEPVTLSYFNIATRPMDTCFDTPWTGHNIADGLRLMRDEQA